MRAALRLVPTALGAGARVLDLGAGPAPAALAAVDHLRDRYGSAGEVLATDASDLALAEARNLSAGSVRTQQAVLNDVSALVACSPTQSVAGDASPSSAHGPTFASRAGQPANSEPVNTAQQPQQD